MRTNRDQEIKLNVLNVRPVLKRLKRVEMPIPKRRRAPIAEPVESIDETVADASSELKSEDPVVDSAEQVWYNIVGYAVKQTSEIKKPLLQAYLKDSGIKNKRVEAFVLGELAKDYFKTEEYLEALSLARDAQQTAKAAYKASGSSFDKTQVDNLEQNVVMIAKKALSKTT
ncbi:hypothetical protein KY315_01400 [Candidatus Woesearchaeota archaeon]|nr:hypothetical protein [Candidatus Woesearchaeota archaeon]